MTFKNKNVTIMGLGLHGGGLGAARYMARKKANVLVTDLKSKEELQGSLDKLKDFDLEFRLNDHKKEDFQKADLVIKNPAVPWDSPYLEAARAAGTKIETAISIFFKETPSECIGITGTKGKSTTASLIYEIVKEKREGVFLAGNIGKQALELLPKLTERSLVVLELSSWQLEGLAREKISPHLSVVTNVFSDHLNRYRDFSEYKQAKKSIVSFQKNKDFAVLNYENKHSREFAQKTDAQVVFFGQKRAKEETPDSFAAYLDGNDIFYQGEKLLDKNEIALKGKHNIFNALAALSCVSVYDFPSQLCEKVLRDFEAPEGRLEFLETKKGLAVYNDTASTNPEATIKAINTLSESKDEPLFLIAGGADKDLSYSELAEVIEKKVDHLFLLAGEASDKLSANLSSDFQEERAEKYFENLDSLLSRVLKIKEKLRPEKRAKLLFSPGAASFNMFKNEFKRGEKFVEALRQL